MTNWDKRYLDLAEYVARWSKDPSTKCGAVIARPDMTIASLGFNGFPKGCSDEAKYYEDRELKYARVLHAEVNAILHAREPLNNYTIYTKQIPHIGPACSNCAAAIIQSGITTIKSNRVQNTPWNDSIKRGLDMFKEAGVAVVLS